MSKISIDQVTQIATLAHLSLGSKELDRLSLELSSILTFVEQLQSADTKDVIPTSQVTGLVDVWREDVVVGCELGRDELLRNAPMTENGFIKVKRIL